jgi:3-oxoacyl-[acyl-carrier protein] reductase
MATATATNRPDTFVVTGCASGIGKQLTGALARDGHRVLATDVRLDALRAAAAEGAWSEERVHLRALDVRDAAAWDATVDEAVAAFGRVDVVMNVAGYLKPGYVVDTVPEDVDRHLDINTKGVIFGTRAAARHMLTQGGGHVVNIASMAALAPVPGISLYTASKYAVRAFSLAAAQELRPRGVYVTVVCPDAVATPMLDLQKDYKEAALTFSAPRILTTDEVVALLLGDVLRRRPLEVILPRSRGWLARVADIFPELGVYLGPLLQRQGASKQRRFRDDGH